MKAISGLNPYKQARIAHYDRRNPGTSQDHGTRGTSRLHDDSGSTASRLEEREGLRLETTAYDPWHPDQAINGKLRRRTLAASELTAAADAILHSAGYDTDTITDVWDKEFTEDPYATGVNYNKADKPGPILYDNSSWADEITAQHRYTRPVDPYEGLSPEDRLDLLDGFHIITPR